MSVKISIPTPLRSFTNNKELLLVDGSTVGDLLRNLSREYSGLRNNLYSEDGRLRSFVNLYVNDEEIRYLEKEQTRVSDGDTANINPSIAGG